MFPSHCFILKKVDFAQKYLPFKYLGATHREDQCNQSSNQITQVVIIPEKMLKRRSDNAEGLMQIDKDGMDGKIKKVIHPGYLYCNGS
ncbi:hypothetical protein GCK72_021330 [Caenorhabditis remanei]|uniref:Uncharacterized protein n=1 Tax=Caenorhabditis remanei TaxID=31234 RepID=A0A6A5GJH4_CAERE|nr:hypothetical protein GCK72_021330 [Caenorhabditis remanei]KAF1754766.1 hypothetical protein GCK72_021330 [Caenorhabditis remanei]